MWFRSNEPTIEDQYDNINLSIRMLKKQSDKSFKQQKQYEKKSREAISNGDMERAQVFAEQSIRHKGLSLRYLNMSLRMEVVAAMAQSAITTGHITSGVTDILNAVTSISNPYLVSTQISQFEKVFDDLSISANVVDNTMDATAGLVTSTEASDLLNKLKEEEAMSLNNTLPSSSVSLSKNKLYTSERKML